MIKQVTWPVLHKGDTGPDVKALQYLLNGAQDPDVAADGIFGAKTETAVRAFQKTVGITVDGIAGKDTFTKLTDGVTTASTVHRGSTGFFVEAAQTELVKYGYLQAKQVDGIFGYDTETATRQFQASVALTVDGIVGPHTWERLIGKG